MDFNYEIKNKKLQKMVENQAKEYEMTVDELIWAYINRGLLSDCINEETFKRVHSDEYMSVINEALDVD